MQNVLFFIFRLYGGGAERVVSSLTMSFADQYNIKVAVYDNLEKTYPYSGELIRIKLPFSEDPVHNNKWKRLIRLIILIYKVGKIKKDHHIDVAVSFAEQANIVNVLTRGKSKTILSVRTTLSKEIASNPKLSVLGHFIRFLYRRTRYIIVPSQAAAEDLSSSFGIEPDKVKVIYNYIEKDRINDMASLGIENSFYQKLFQHPVLLNVGRINPAKGQWLLFDVLKKIKSELPGWKLVIIGESETEGNLKSQLVDLAASLGLLLYDSSSGQEPSMGYDIYLLGYQANPFHFMHHSKVLLFPSVYEGFPNTVLEAMQCGLPVISADCHAGPREILAPGSDVRLSTQTMEITPFGVLAPAMQVASIQNGSNEKIVEEWVKATVDLINNPPLRQELIANGYTRVRQFDKDLILKEWKKLFETT
jgi:glycosyltransferase involved in cell wall biosynthesis